MFTHFNSKNEPDRLSIVAADQVYQKIKSDIDIQQQCSRIRSLTKEYNRTGDLSTRDKKEQEKAKLSAFIPSGEFSYRSNSSVTKYWGRIVLDLDNLSRPETLRAKIKSDNDPTLLMMFLSPSGTGLKIIHQLDTPEFDSMEDITDFHKQAFRFLVAYYVKKYRVTEIDESGSDIARLCYYSSDNAAYFNPDATGLKFNYRPPCQSVTPIVKTEIGGYYSTFTPDNEKLNVKVVREIINWCGRENINLVDNYNDWIRALFALKNTFTDSRLGMELFLQLSATSPKYKREECIEKWDSTETTEGGRKVTLGTIIYMARSLGWTAPKNFYIGKGSAFNSCVTTLEESNIRLKYNNLTHQLYYLENPHDESWQLVNNYIEGRIKLDVLKMSMRGEEFEGFIQYVPPRYNHVDDFLDSLPEWDGKDRFRELIGTLTLSRNMESDLSGILLKRWMIGVINGLHNRPENGSDPSISPNENLLILIGSQGIGKTRWMRKLMPENWHSLFAEKLSFNFDDKDDKLLSCEKAIIAMDELSPILNNKATNEQLKGFLSQKTFNVRVAYGRHNNIFYKIASFMGTSNHSEIITDPTGSRRFWPIEIVSADYNHEIDMAQLWAQTYASWKAGEQHWLNLEEQGKLADYNEPFRKIHPYEEYINRFVRQGRQYYTATEIAEQINAHLQNRNAVNPRQLGIYLKKAGYENTSRHIKGKTHRVYEVYLEPVPNFIEATEIVRNEQAEVANFNGAQAPVQDAQMAIDFNAPELN
jgi:hypothetical protein